METIVRKLNEKAVDLGAEGNAKTVVEALNQIVKATGGTPSTTNKITDAIEKIQFGEGGGSGTISEENCIVVKIRNNAVQQIRVNWSSSRHAEGYFVEQYILRNAEINFPYCLKTTGGKSVFCAYFATPSSLPSGKLVRATCDNDGTLVQADISNEGGRPLEMLVYVEWDASVESPTITFSLVDEVVES